MTEFDVIVGGSRYDLYGLTESGRSTSQTAELELNEGNKKQATETLKTAERRINEMGCHRWDREVERLKELLDRRRHSTY